MKTIEREDKYGNTVTATSHASGEQRLRCTCGWTNKLYRTQEEVTDFMSSHLRQHYREEQ